MDIIALIIAIIALVGISRLKQKIALLEEDVATLIREFNALSNQKNGSAND